MKFMVYALIVCILYIHWCSAKPINKIQNKSHVIEFPSHVRKVQLYSKQGYFLTILANGTISGTTNKNSKDAILEMESFSVKLKRIRRPNSFYLSIDTNGKAITTPVSTKHSLLFEQWNGNYLSYRKYISKPKNPLKPKYIFAMSANKRPIHGKTQISKNSLFILLPSPL